MQRTVNLGELKDPQDIKALQSAFEELFDINDVLYTETAPNGSISANRGKIALYKNGSTYEKWVNVDGGTTWSRIDSADFITGDWIISSVTTARSGWTDVSATYANKFMRINATPLTTGGADTFTLAEANLPSHTHGVGTFVISSGVAYFISFPSGSGGYYALRQDGSLQQHSSYNNNTPTGGHTLSGLSAATGSGTAVSNVPAYVQVCVFQKN